MNPNKCWKVMREAWEKTGLVLVGLIFGVVVLNKEEYSGIIRIAFIIYLICDTLLHVILWCKEKHKK